MRMMKEYDKYFAADTLPFGVPDIPQQFSPSSYRYFSPLEIQTFDKDPVDQTQYRDREAPISRYDINRYGELLSDIFKIKNHTEYLDRPFTQYSTRFRKRYSQCFIVQVFESRTKNTFLQHY